MLTLPHCHLFINLFFLCHFLTFFPFCGCCIYVPCILCPHSLHHTPPHPPSTPLLPSPLNPTPHFIPSSLLQPFPPSLPSQGSWWSHGRAVSPPSSSQDSLGGEGGWDSPKPRPPDSPLWSMRVVKMCCYLELRGSFSFVFLRVPSRTNSSCVPPPCDDYLIGH